MSSHVWAGHGQKWSNRKDYTVKYFHHADKHALAVEKKTGLQINVCVVVEITDMQPGNEIHLVLSKIPS